LCFLKTSLLKKMNFIILLIVLPALIGLLDTSGRGFSDAVLIERKELIDFDSITLELLENFAICGDMSVVFYSFTAMNGRIYASCDDNNIRVFNSTTYQQLDDIIVNLDEGYSRLHISGCPDTNSLFIIEQKYGGIVEKKVKKVNLRDNSQSVLISKNDKSEVWTFSTSPFDCRLILAMWEKVEDQGTITIEVFDQEGSLVKAVPASSQIKFPDTVLETSSGTYLIAEDRSPDVPYLLKHLDRNGKMLETLRKDDTVHNVARASNFDPAGIAIDQLGNIYAAGPSGEVLMFDQKISRNRVMIPWPDSDYATKVLYDASTDRVLVYMSQRKKNGGVRHSC